MSVPIEFLVSTSGQMSVPRQYAIAGGSIAGVESRSSTWGTPWFFFLRAGVRKSSLELSLPRTIFDS